MSIRGSDPRAEGEQDLRVRSGGRETRDPKNVKTHLNSRHLRQRQVRGWPRHRGGYRGAPRVPKRLAGSQRQVRQHEQVPSQDLSGQDQDQRPGAVLYTLKAGRY